MILDVTDLEVYQISLKLVEKLYDLLKKIPKSEFDTINQVKRSTKSIQEFKRFLQIALGSSDETITHLRMLYIASPYSRELIKNLAEEFKVLSKRLNKLHSSWISN